MQRRLVFPWLLFICLLAPAVGRPTGYEFIRHQGQLVRHPLENLPWRIYVNDQRYYPATLHAMRTWNGAGHRLGYPDLFAPVDNRRDADMVMDWSGRGLPPDKAAGVWWDFNPGGVRISKMVIDPHHRVPEGNRAQILLQELGHILGLGDSSDSDDVMHPVMHSRRYRAVEEAELTSRDLEAFRWLYSQERYIPIVSSARRTDTPAGVEQPAGEAGSLLLFDPIRVELTASVNVRITLRNPTQETVRGPLRLELWGRVPGNPEWRELKVWRNLQKIPSGYRVSRDYFSDLQPLFQGEFELMSRVVHSESGDILGERSYP